MDRSSVARYCKIIILTGCFVCTSCGPKPAPTPIKHPDVSTPKPTPTNLTATPASGSVALRWITNLPENSAIKGFNIYRARESGDFELVTPLPYPGDLESRSDIETFEAPGLENGVEYRFRVSTVYAGDFEATGVDIVAAIPRPDGAFSLTSSFSGASAGFSFARISSVPTDDLSNDIYLATIKGKLHLASPSRIDDVLRKTEFFKLRQGRTFAYSPPKEPTGVGEELTAISVGDEIIVRTSARCYAYLKIVSIASDNESVEVSYVYQTRPETFSF